MKTFVQYGAGNIGRGFIGALFSQAGYRVRFIDVNREVIGALNERGQYPVEIVSGEGNRDVIITNVEGIDGMDREAVTLAIAQADAMATAVGVNIMPRIVPLITAGLKKRWQAGNTAPFNIIICENLLDADKLMRSLIEKELSEQERSLFDSTVGLVEASIGRMVPVMTEEMRRGDVLRVCVEEYCQLPVDGAAWKGEFPSIKNMHPFSPFALYIERKLFVHNMGHAMTAYLGNLQDLTYIWEAIGNPYIKLLSGRAMAESAMALSRHFGYPLEKLTEHIDDLLLRFGNRALGDTVARVGRDTRRKLSASDRFAGALKLCEQEGVECIYIALGAAAGLFFQNSDDEGSAAVHGILISEGIDAVISKHMGLLESGPASRYIKTYFTLLSEGAAPEALLQQAEAFKRAVLAPKHIV